MLPLTVARRTHTPGGYPDAPSVPDGDDRYPRRVSTTQDRRDARRRRGADRRRGDAGPPGARPRRSTVAAGVRRSPGCATTATSSSSCSARASARSATRSRTRRCRCWCSRSRAPGCAMGVVGVLTTLPDLLLGLPAGAYADRWDRRRMMFVADLGRCVLTALIPISVALGGPTLVVILAVTFPLNSLRVLWLAAYTAAVPGLVGRAEVAARERDLRGGVQRRLDRRARARRPARRHDRPRARRSPSTPSRSCCRPARCCSSGGRCGPRRGPIETHILADIREGVAYVVRAADAAGVHRAVDDDVRDLGRASRPR